jgi:hypothetical protein
MIRWCRKNHPSWQTSELKYWAVRCVSSYYRTAFPCPRLARKTQGLHTFPRLRLDQTYVLEFLLSGGCILWSVSCKEPLDAARRFVEIILSAVGSHNCRVSVVYSVVRLTTGPKPLPMPALHIVRSSASSFKCEYPLLSLRSSSSFLRLLLRLPVTSIPPFIFSSITRCRRQFLRKIWPIQLAFRLLISCRIFLCSLTLSNTSCLYRPTNVQSFWQHMAHFRGYPLLLGFFKEHNYNKLQ